MFTLLYDIIHGPHPFWVGFVVLPVSIIGVLAGLVLLSQEARHVRYIGVGVIVSALVFWTYG